MLRELTPSSQHRADVIKMQTVLKSLVVFGSSMDRFLYLLIPTLIRVIEMPIFVTTMRQNALTTMTSASRNVTSSGLVVSSREQSDKVKHAAIRALGKLAQELDFSDYASRIIHSLTRVVQRATATNLSSFSSSSSSSSPSRSLNSSNTGTNRIDTQNESTLPTAYSIFYESGMLLRQSQTAPSSDSNDAISNKERDALLALQALNTLCTLVEQLGSEYSALWVTLEKLISPPKSNRKKKLVSSAFGSLQHHLHEKHQRWYKHLAAKILHHNRNLDAPYRRYETRSLVNLSSGSQDLESRNTASFALGGFSSRGKTSSDEGMGFFSTNASLQAHGGSQSGLDTIIGGSSSFSSSKRRHTSEDFERSVVRVDLKMNEKKLIQAFEASLRSTKEDWNEWIARISEQLLLESPSPSLRACSQLHQLHRQLSRELFNAAFVSCWTDMGSQSKAKVLCALEIAFRSDTIPAEILQTLLKLAEFMEHDDKPLPINKNTLASLAEQCHAYAKALHYKEQEFQELLRQSSSDKDEVLTDLSGIVESLISINSKLDQPEAAVGILKFAQFKYASLIDLQESWYEKLNRWEDALAGYERKLSDDIGTQTSSSSTTSSSKTSDLKSNRSSLNNVLGMMRCLDVLMQWQKLQAIADDVWPRLDPSTRQHIAPKLALATWGLGKWEQMRRYTDLMDSSTAKASFYKAVIAIHDGRLEAARGHVNRSRMLIADGLTPLLAESYNRAYPSMVMVRSFEL